VQEFDWQERPTSELQRSFRRRCLTDESVTASAVLIGACLFAFAFYLVGRS